MSFQAYFVSDIHLKSKDELNAQIFLRFLKSLHSSETVTHLFLVGDIFDFWVSDHNYFIEKFHPIVEELDRLVQRGLLVSYFEGNHDLHLERYWQRKLGIKVYNQPDYFELGEFKVRVEHGDLIDPEDKGYLFLKSVLNTKAMKIFADHVHEGVVRRIGERASQASRKYTSETKTISEEETIQKIRSHAMRAYLESPYDFLIGGHVHVKEDYSFVIGDESARAINLGTWMKEPIAFMMSPTKQEFIKLV